MITTIYIVVAFVICIYDFIFQSNFSFTAKLIGKYRDFTYISCPTQVYPLPLSIYPTRVGFVTTDEPTLTNHHHTKSTDYIRVHSWCCTSYAFRQCIMVCIHHYSITQEYFHFPKNLLYSTYSFSPTPPTPGYH